ncbi:MAG TPA: TolC family protein [Burkholderiales bacterium]|nr:TolC family protein [Burkholderiales bacterium]
MKPELRRWALVAAGCAFWSTSAVAQEGAPPDAVDLSAVVRLVKEVSPRLAAERQSVAVAEAERVGAAALPNPTVGYNYFRPSGGAATVFEGSRQQQFGVELPVPLSGQRAARMEAAERGVDAARARVLAGGSTLAADAAAGHIDLLAAQEQMGLLSASVTELERLRTIIVGRQASGMASRYEVTRIEVELGGTRARLGEARAKVADRAGTLAALLGFPRWRPQALGSLAPLEIGTEAPATAQERASGSPAAVAALREEEAARAGIEVAKRERIPTPTFNVGRTWTSDPFGAANFVGMSVEIPILDARRGPQAKAEAQAIQANLRRQLVEAETAANLDRLAQIISHRKTSLEHFDREATQRIAALKQMAEDAYQLGRGSILELLDAVRSRYELQQARVELAAALLEAQVRYLALNGTLEQRLGSARR